MKRNIFSVLSLILALSLTGMASCGDSKDAKPAKAPAAKTEVKGTLPNYRYVDADTILAKYNLSKDFDEQMIRLQNDLESEAKRHETQIRNLQTSMQQKMQNNQYTEATYKADQNRLAQMSGAAEQALGQKQNSMQQSAAAAQKTLNDSIQAFLEDYNKVHGYDAIFYKAATALINPALDITDEVVEGLNARYNKVKK